MNFKVYAQAASVLLVLGGGSAAAQELSCGGIGAGGFWLGVSEAESDIATAATPLSERVAVAPGDRMVGYFNLSQPMDLRVEAEPEDFGDTVLELYDANGVMILTDDDSGGDLSSRAELFLEPGSYCLAVRAFGGGAVSATMMVSRLEQEALTAGLAGGFAGTETDPPFVGVQPCVASTPAFGLGQIDLMPSASVAATNTITGTPYYRFTIGAPLALTIRAENPAADPYIYVFDANGTLLAENDDYDSLNSRIDFTSPPLQPGTYCIAMRALSDPDLPVTLTVAEFDQAAAALEEFATGFTAPPRDGSLYPVRQLGILPNFSLRDTQVIGGQAVFYAMEIVDPGLLLITADEVRDSDPYIVFFDEDGFIIAENDDSNGTLNSQIAVPVDVGRYMLAVRQYSSGYQGVIRIGMQRYVPAQ